MYIIYFLLGKIDTIKELFLSYWFNFTLASLIVLMMIYIAVIQIVIDMNSRPDFRFSKNETEEQGFMRSKFEYSKKENHTNDNQKKEETKDETDNSSAC